MVTESVADTVASRGEVMSDTVSPRRRPDLGLISGLAEQAPREWSLELYRRYKSVREFELQARKAGAEKMLDIFVYLSVGEEAVACAPSMSLRGSWVLGQHRGHGIYLAFGGNPERLADELIGLPTGSNGGMGGSPPIQDFGARIIGHNGLIGDQVPVAAGVALSLPPGERVVCYFGDGAAEEDYVLAALGFVASRKLPVLFICADNDLSVLTKTAVRRNWELTEVARSFGIKSVDIADDPWLIDHWVRQFKDDLPALINVRTCREVWHVGYGSDEDAEWNRYEMVRETLKSLQLGHEVTRIDADVEQGMARLWQERLRIPSKS